jgi:hypothetical protein
LLNVGARVRWHDDEGDQGTLTEKTWAGVILKWDSQSDQPILNK